MDETQGVLAESPPAAPESAPAPAPLAPGQPDPGFGFDPQQQHVPYTRFKEINDRYQSERQQWAQEREQYARLAQWAAQQAQQQQARPAQPTTTLGQEELAAGQALRRLIEHHPELQPLFRMMQAAPALAQGYGQVTQMQQQMAQATLAGGRNEVQRLATTASLPVSPEHVKYYEGLVAETLRLMPGGVERFNRGDLSVLGEAWPAVHNFLKGFTRQAEQQQVRSRQQIQNLPPRMRGSAPGAPLPKKLGAEDDARDFIRAMHTDAAKVIGQGTTG